MPPFRKRTFRTTSFVTLIIASVLLAGCGVAELPMSTFSNDGFESQQIQKLFWPIFWMGMAVFVVVNGILLISIVRYRRRPEDGIPVQLHGNTRVELAWTIAPAILVLGIAVMTFRTQAVIGREPVNPLQVTVIGHQWWWEFEYPEYGIVTANELHLPVNRDVLFTLRSADVVHAFAFPRLYGVTDVIPGHENKILLRPQVVTEELIRGHCREFCGGTHAQMAMHVAVRSEADFNSWIQQQRAAAPVPAGVQQSGGNQAAAPAETPVAVGATITATVIGEDATGDEVAATTAATVVATAEAETTSTAVAQATSPEAKGYQLFASKGCIGCHAIQGYPGAASRVGPDLTHVGSRGYIVAGWLPNTPENMRRWLRDPNAVKPDNVMGTVIKLGTLKPDEIEALTAYLESLK